MHRSGFIRGAIMILVKFVKWETFVSSVPVGRIHTRNKHIGGIDAQSTHLESFPIK